jgi:HK97 family phage portal protein
MKIFSFFNRSKQEQPRPKKRTIGMSGGTLVSEDSAMEVSAFYRGVIYISTQIAKLPWDVKDKQNNNIVNNIHYLLNVSPNYEMTAFHFKLFMIQCAIVGGNGYAEIERTIDLRPVAL